WRKEPPARWRGARATLTPAAHSRPSSKSVLADWPKAHNLSAMPTPSATPAELVCWKCGASLADLTLPLRRLEECREKTRANFCDFFKPRRNAYVAPNTTEVDRARAELDKLFGK